jgi:uncharacterized protein (TIGR03435 family)
MWTAAPGQVRPTAPKFDVASVKAVHDQAPGGYTHMMTADSVTMRGVSMGYCIRLAYGLSVQRPYQLVGPGWIDPPTDFVYDISAKAAAPASADRMRLMLQSLLAERFGLAVHREPRDLPAYALLAGRSQPSLRPSDPMAQTSIRSGEESYSTVFTHVSMDQLALQLGPPATSRPVVNKTGLQGSFDFTLKLARYVLDSATGRPETDLKGMVDTEGAILRAVRDQLGLILKPEHAAFDVLIVDHLDKTPSAN